MTNRIRFHPTAREEYADAVLSYEAARPGLGEEFRDEVAVYVERAASGELPGTRLRTIHGHSLRRLILHRFPYAIIFEIGTGECTVWAVAHSRRRPGFWRKRLRAQ